MCSSGHHLAAHLSYSSMLDPLHCWALAPERQDLKVYKWLLHNDQLISTSHTMCTYKIRRQWVLQCALTQCARGKYCQQGMGGTQMHSRSLTPNQLEAELWENTDCSCITSAVTCCFIRRSWMSSTVHSKTSLRLRCTRDPGYYGFTLDHHLWQECLQQQREQPPLPQGNNEIVVL